MKNIRETCVYLCGPYHGYCGKAEYDHGSDLFHGEVAGTRDVVTFQGRTPGELRKAFQKSVNVYLAYCREQGEPPEKPFSGKFMTRIDPELHRKISTLADAASKSLNQYISDCLSSIAAGSPTEPGPLGVEAPDTRRSPRRKKGRPTSKGNRHEKEYTSQPVA